MRAAAARLLELLAGEAIACAPLAVLWWFAYLDQEDRGALLERGREWIRIHTGAELRAWTASPAAAYGRWRADDMIRGENDAQPIDPWGDEAEIRAFIGRLDATVDELEAEGVR